MQYRRPAHRNASVDPVRKWTRRGGWLHRLLAGATQGAYTPALSFSPERLEERRLLTTLGNVGTGLVNQYDFYSGQNQVCEISYFDVQLEAVGIMVNTSNPVPTITLGNLVQPSNPEPAFGTNIYSLYVTQSNADSFISIYQIDPKKGTPLPFAGAVPTWGITQANGAAGVVNIQANTGSVLIGAIDPSTKPQPTLISGYPLNTPIGIMPAPAGGILTPGITVLQVNASGGVQNNFGNLLIGGTVTGTVSIGGNISEFYAGNVLTGNASGDLAANYTYVNGNLVTEGTSNGPTGTRALPGNFSVAGDLGALLTTGSVGTDATFTGAQPSPRYLTDFDLTVGGKLGEMKVGNSARGYAVSSFVGTIAVGNSPYIDRQLAYPSNAPTGSVNVIGNTTTQLEIENTATPNPDIVWALGELDLVNDTPADAEFLNSTPVTNPDTGAPVLNANGKVEFTTSVYGNILYGSLGDTKDYYAAALLAGQPIQVSVASNNGTGLISNAGAALLEVLIYDPDGRLVASTIDAGIGGVQQFTPDRPGVYTFEVTQPTTDQITATYQLTVSGIPEQGIAGISVGGDYNDGGVDQGIILGNADIGAIVVGGTYGSTTTGPTPIQSSTGIAVTAPVFASTSILVASGNLDAFVAGQMGVQDGGFPDIIKGPTLSVPDGSIGLIKTTTGPMELLTQFDPNYLNEPTPQYVTNDNYATAIGGFIQTIDAATMFQSELAVNAGIGTIRAGNMATDIPSYIDVNADNQGSDGIIDLFAVDGDLGTLADGGPVLVTNNGGDVRYMTVGGALYRPEIFGGGIDDPITYPAGQSATITDASGNTITATPIGVVVTTTTTTATTPATNSSNGSTNTSTTTTSNTVSVGPQITILSYPTTDKGGSIPVSITSSGGMNLSVTGARGSEVNIGTLGIAGTGSPIVAGAADQYGNPTITQTPPTLNVSTGTVSTTTTTTNADGSTTTVTTNVSGGGTTTFLDLKISGNEVVNVLNTTATGDVTSIVNNTLGELVNLTATDVGQILVHGNLGFATPRATAAAVLPRAVITDGNTYPFVQQHTGIVVSGDAVDIDAYGGIGNVVVTGTLQSLIANFGVTTHQFGASATPGQFDGIVGPIYGGSLLYIDIGQGVLPTGTGTVGLSGIFATGTVGVVTNTGNNNSDIRGNIVSNAASNTEIGVDAISLKNGSILNSRIWVVANADLSVSDALSVVARNTPSANLSPFASPYIYEVGAITITGLGGMIGDWISSTDIGQVTVTNGGFGILSSKFDLTANGRDQGITASGYGIRDCSMLDGAYCGQIVANGGGQDVSVLTYPLDVRESDVPNQLDPYFGFTPNVDTDLNAALGTTAQQPNIPNVTDTGVIQDCVFDGGQTLAGLVAQKVRTAQPLYNSSAGTTLPTPTLPVIPTIGIDFPMEINFAAGIGVIRIFQQVDGLQITTGHLEGFFPSSSVSRVGINVAGPINYLKINGNFGQYITNAATGLQIPDSYINAGGPSGNIGTVIVTGDLNGTLSATGTIGSIFVGHDVEAGIIARGQTTGLALGSLHVQGGIRDGSLVLDGSVGSIIVNGTLGTSTASLAIEGNANLISIGAYHRLLNSDLALKLSVGGYLRNLTVFGTISGSVTVANDLTNLRVTGSGAASVIITGSINVGGRIGTAVVTGGSVGGSIIADNSIGSFTINRGSLLVPGIVESEIAGIGFFRIIGGASYGLYGSLLAQSGLNDRIDISGNLGDGVNTATVTAQSGTTFHIRGSVADHANVQLSGQLNLLQVDGNIATGAVIVAHPLVKQKIKGTNSGSITIV